MNEITIPEYLRPYIALQNLALYTHLDHAGWRFIMKLSRAFLSIHAHEMYLAGLEATGISTDRIPLISEMSQKLRKFGWEAVPVCGFIPPAVFMEFLSLGILPIACDMRRLEHLAYTPAPDIVHEAAGHAPIIADPEYAAYLRRYGEISRKAIHSSHDLAVYAAIRHLSDIKEDPISKTHQVEQAERQLEEALSAINHDSEATWLARMSWWTIEYGLIGDESSPKLYGAGLLSSIGESYKCLGQSVKRLPLSIDCIYQGYDITNPQPQLYIASNFKHMATVLDELAGRMAFSIGGFDGLMRAKKASTVTTTVLDSGLQVSGIVENIITAKHDATLPIFVQYRGPIQLAFEDKELELHLTTQIGLSLYSGIKLDGRLVRHIKQNDKTIANEFSDLVIRLDGHELFRSPAGKTAVVAYGSSVKSVFGGAADRSKYLAATGGFHQEPRAPKTNLTADNRGLNILYAKVRCIRESGDYNQLEALTEVHAELEQCHPSDWLLRYELLELNAEYKLQAPWEGQIHKQLNNIAASSTAKAEMIERGLALLGAIKRD